ncbi:MAG: hypothetical protein U5R31_04460 [Acidimicrobiia bacterium]|nr:hypothetical protein [Acidimicrobiia bacterium]
MPSSAAATWAGDQVGDVQDQAGSALRGLGLGGDGSNGSSRPGGGRPSGARAARPAPPKPTRPEPPEGPPVDVDTLAIPDYDSLSASQVVPRLAGLASEELEQVRRYEAGARGRKTILNKIAQLQST